jgi:hypothetical protein
MTFDEAGTVLGILVLVMGLIGAALIRFYFIEKRRHVERVIKLAEGREDE